MKIRNLLFVVVALAFTVGCDHYSQGDRVGVVYKFSHKRLLCKTWEGEMNLGGMRTQSDSNGNTQTVPNVWSFTVREEDLAKFQPLISESLSNGTTVKISYDQSLWAPCDSEDGYFVTNVVELKH